MATLTNKATVLSIEEKVKVIIEEYKRKQTELTCARNLVSLIPQSKICGKTEPKLLVRWNGTDFESLNEVTSMSRCLSSFSKGKLKMYQ